MKLSFWPTTIFEGHDARPNSPPHVLTVQITTSLPCQPGADLGTGTIHVDAQNARRPKFCSVWMPLRFVGDHVGTPEYDGRTVVAAVTVWRQSQDYAIE
ncbi:hypothetical protein DL770_005411 [Monosporascus sp. CRB-9-2]|nr:hypothetical protein DL770_005411 [Monosporascus sp. CRB-9-2]